MDVTREETSEEVTQFVNSIRTFLRALEERNIWTNRVELCIWNFREVGRKYTKGVTSPLKY